MYLPRLAAANKCADLLFLLFQDGCNNKHRPEASTYEGEKNLSTRVTLFPTKGRQKYFLDSFICSAGACVYLA